MKFYGYLMAPLALLILGYFLASEFMPGVSMCIGTSSLLSALLILLEYLEAKRKGELWAGE